MQDHIAILFLREIIRFANLSENEITAFYLTDFLVKQFDSFVWKPMGLDKHPELLDMYFGNYTKLVYQAQINDPKLDTKAIEISERMGLPLERTTYFFRNSTFKDLKLTNII